ncbi:MAG: site-specific integrase [Acidobacteria bacterium]|nr:site-specific integrase [Acidobacteriota bacterium]
MTDYQVNGRKSNKRAEVALRSLRGFFGFSRAVDITTDRITRYIRQRQEAGIQPATIRYDLSILKRAFTLALQAEKLDRKPYIPSIEVRNVRTGFFSEDEVRAAVSHLPEHLQSVVRFLFLTGWRRTETLTLQWQQIDWDSRTIRLEPGTTKNDEGRVYPFAQYPDLENILRFQRERTVLLQQATAQIIPWVFHKDGKRIRDFRKAWDNACEAAGLQGRWVHDFRRSCVRRMERKGVPRSWAMKLTGHKTESIYRRYAIVSESDLSEGVAKLAAPDEPKKMEPGVVDQSSSGKAQTKQWVQ